MTLLLQISQWPLNVFIICHYHQGEHVARLSLNNLRDHIWNTWSIGAFTFSSMEGLGRTSSWERVHIFDFPRLQLYVWHCTAVISLPWMFFSWKDKAESQWYSIIKWILIFNILLWHTICDLKKTLLQQISQWHLNVFLICHLPPRGGWYTQLFCHWTIWGTRSGTPNLLEPSHSVQWRDWIGPPC